jgi:hypothetical protein
MALHFLYYDFVRIHQTLQTRSALGAGVTSRLWETSEVIEMIDAFEKRRKIA